MDWTGPCPQWPPEQASGSALIFVFPDGNNSIIIISGANVDWPLSILWQRVRQLRFGRLPLILLQREIPERVNMAIVALAKAGHPPVPVLLDMGGDHAPLSPELLSGLFCLLPMRRNWPD